MGRSEGTQLQALFLAELRERTLAMRECVAALRTVQDPGRRAELMESLSRDAHSIKGGAALLGWRSIAELAAAVEQHIAAAASGTGQDLDLNGLDQAIEEIQPPAAPRAAHAPLDALWRSSEGGRSGAAGPAEDAASVGGRRRGGAQEDRPPLIVLLVEDEPVNRALVRAILERGEPTIGPCSVREAATLAAARTILASGSVDLVLLDMRLPDGDGLALARELAARPGRPPIIGTSATAAPEGGGGPLGVDAFIAKPIAGEELLAAISRLAR